MTRAYLTYITPGGWIETRIIDSWSVQELETSPHGQNFLLLGQSVGDKKLCHSVAEWPSQMRSLEVLLQDDIDALPSATPRVEPTLPEDVEK